MSAVRATLAAAAALAIATGCLPIPSRVRTGRGVSARDAGRVEPRRTTKARLLEWFGPPEVIAQLGARAAPGTEHVADAPIVEPASVVPGERENAQRGDAWFEPFAVRHTIRDSHRVYYWSCTRRGGFVAFLLVGISTRHESMHELWVLVDEETGVAEGAVYRER